MVIPEPLQDRLADIRSAAGELIDEFMADMTAELVDQYGTSGALVDLAIIAAWQREPLITGEVPPFTLRFHQAKEAALADGRSWPEILTAIGEPSGPIAAKNARRRHRNNRDKLTMMLDSEDRGGC